MPAKTELGVKFPTQTKALGVFEAISTNVAVREFSEDRIREEQFREILKAAQLCQSGKNLQPWHFILIRSKQLLNKIADEMKGDVDEEIVRGAPASIAMISDPSSEFHIVDTARAAQNMTLVAWELGIGSCWISGLERPNRERCRNKVKQILRIPANLNLLDLMVLGYPKEPPMVKWKNRKKLRDITSRDTYGNPLILKEVGSK